MEDFPLLTSLKLNLDVFLRIVLHLFEKVGLSPATMHTSDLRANVLKEAYPFYMLVSAFAV